MRIPIREQLGALFLFTTLAALAAVAVSTWITNKNFILALRSSRLSLTASLKAGQLASNLLLMSTIASALSTRIRLQGALRDYNAGNASSTIWDDVRSDFEITLDGGALELLALQLKVYPINVTDTSTGAALSVLNVTGAGIPRLGDLPETYPNGSNVRLGDPGPGYPHALYPNSTFPDDIEKYFLYGPLQTNASFGLVSITRTVVDTAGGHAPIGWITVVFDARLIYNVVQSDIGLDRTGTVLLVGPTTADNRFGGTLMDANPPFSVSPSTLDDTQVRFVLPPDESRYSPARHSLRDSSTANLSFPLSAYPAILADLTTDYSGSNNAGGQTSVRNEQGFEVSVGYAIPPTDLCSWVLVLEESQSEVMQPLYETRNVLLGSVFGTAGGIFLIIWIFAHFASRPIRRLRDATKQTVEPSDLAASRTQSHLVSLGPESTDQEKVEDSAEEKSDSPAAKSTAEQGRNDFHWGLGPSRFSIQSRERLARIPGKVKDGKHIIQDELTDLTQTFNEMSDDLMQSWSVLEDRVKQRTAELEASKKAAEAANESKTLFVANLSHELKTPLNGILGMCAVCMQEEDLSRIKHSLSVIYQSGDLLHNLLNDLLTFSRNQVGQALSLDEKEFRLRDVGTQLKAIFDKQAQDGSIAFKCSYRGPNDAQGNESVEESDRSTHAPQGLGRVKDMYLWGDQHRVLQIAINLVSNSLKFTAPGGSVHVTIRCLTPEFDGHQESERRSRPDKARFGSTKPSKQRPVDTHSLPFGTANQINPRERYTPSRNTDSSEQASSVPSDARTIWFEFEVADTGPGIPEHLQQQVFEPFVQGDLKLTKRFGGTGLGLSICLQLAKLMGGSIKLESMVGVGSTFTLLIPFKYVRARAHSTGTSVIESGRRLSMTSMLAATPADDSPEQGLGSNEHLSIEGRSRLVGLSQPFFTSATSPMASPLEFVDRSDIRLGGRKVRVLVAEDNKVNQEVVLRMLQLEEVFDVELAKDGQEAVDKVEHSMAVNEPYDLIFMDVQMPKLDGRQSTRRIREIGYSAPIVALTAFADESNKKECLDSGMDYFLAKPIKRPALKHVLKTYCPPIEEADEAAAGAGKAAAARSDSSDALLKKPAGHDSP